MLVSEHEIEVPAPSCSDGESLLETLRDSVEARLPADFQPVRFVVTETKPSTWRCEVGGISGLDGEGERSIDPLFRFERRAIESTEQFNTVLMVPTGIGAEVGGHAGDAAPVAKLLGEVSDRVVVHPNVVNGSDLNEMPSNALYVEGSVLTRLLMGTAGLQPVRANRVLVVIDDHEDKLFVNGAINAVSAARATYGLACPEVVCLSAGPKMKSRFAASGRAAGRVEKLETLCHVLDERRHEYDAVALSSVIDVPPEFHQGYFSAGGNMVNPWGGVEAMLTHSVSSIYNIPVAHAPMFESRDVADEDPGPVDPRMAAEAVSLAFLQSSLKGLQRSPRIINGTAGMSHPEAFTVENVACLVQPDGCVGLPTLAAIEQGITVISVGENDNLMVNDLSCLPWRRGQLIRVRNYWEAAGAVASLRAGIAPDATRRPLGPTRVDHENRLVGNQSTRNRNQTACDVWPS